MVKCPYCSYEGEFKVLKQWKFRFYDVKYLQCPKCKGRFNHYIAMSPRKGKVSEFYIKIKPRAIKKS